MLSLSAVGMCVDKKYFYVRKSHLQVLICGRDMMIDGKTQDVT